VPTLDDRRGEMRPIVPFDNCGVSASSTEEHSASAASTQNSTTRLDACSILLIHLLDVLELDAGN
jgi:hypothetical protein